MKITVNIRVEVAQPQNPEVLQQLSKLAEVKKKNTFKRIEQMMTVLYFFFKIQVALILQVRTDVRGEALNHRQNHELYPQKEVRNTEKSH